MDAIVDRLVIEWQLEHGWSPTKILYAHFREQASSSTRTAAEKRGLREAKQAVAVVKPKFFMELAKASGKSLASLIQLFKDSRVVRFFKKIGWSFKKLHEKLKAGYNNLKELQRAFSDYVKESKVGKWTARQLTSERLKNIDEWMKRNPKIKRLTGVAVGAILIYIWFNMTFVGNPLYDFDLSDMVAALGGSFSLEALFSGPKGATLLLLFLTGAFAGLTFPWPGAAGAKFIVAITSTLAKRLRKALTPAKQPLEQQAEQMGLAVAARRVAIARQIAGLAAEVLAGM